jgi:hypothetical protein
MSEDFHAVERLTILTLSASGKQLPPTATKPGEFVIAPPHRQQFTECKYEPHPPPADDRPR